jgi:hypothetical protein
MVDAVRNVRRLIGAGLGAQDVSRFGACLEEPDLESSAVCPGAVRLFERRLSSVEGRIAELVQVRDRLAEDLAKLRRRAAS